MGKLSGAVKYTIGYTSLKFKSVVWAGDESSGVMGILVFKFIVMRLDEISKGVPVGKEKWANGCLEACQIWEEGGNQKKEKQPSVR